MKPRQYVHLLLIISELIIIGCCLIIIIKYDRSEIDELKDRWICSEILTLKKVIEDNNYNIHPLNVHSKRR